MLSSTTTSEGNAATGAPTDALPDDVRLTTFRPRLNIAGFEYNFASPTDVTMKYKIVNVGEGTASRVATFIPGLENRKLTEPISAGGSVRRSIRLSERSAYFEMLPAYAQVVVEFEDAFGNLYRQYGTIRQNMTVHGRFKYEVGN